jgi:hypothetical protein
MTQARNRERSFLTEQEQQEDSGSNVMALPRQTTNWNDVRSPGAYVDVQSGCLYRFLPESITRAGGQNASPVIHQTGRQSKLQQISTDPFISQQEARQRAQDAGVNATF